MVLIYGLMLRAMLRPNHKCYCSFFFVVYFSKIYILYYYQFDYLKYFCYDEVNRYVRGLIGGKN